MRRWVTSPDTEFYQQKIRSTSHGMTKTSVVVGAMLKSSATTVQLNVNCSFWRSRNKLMHCKPISLPTHDKLFCLRLESLKLWDQQRLTVCD